MTKIKVEEFYTKENGVVYWYFRFNGGDWKKIKISYTEIPHKIIR